MILLKSSSAGIGGSAGGRCCTFGAQLHLVVKNGKTEIERQILSPSINSALKLGTLMSWVGCPDLGTPKK